MKLAPAVCYRAVLARDARYDGRFFTCVKTTAIYCRPICPARPPRIENCEFVPTAAAAQEAGFRPCLRCRPESSPDLNAWRGTSATVSRALKLIEGGALDADDVDSIATRLNIGSRQLRRLFRKHVGAAPVTVAQTRRILLARLLIQQTRLSMTQVALASGFGSVRRFNETFQQLYQRPPGDLRRHAPGAEPIAPEISLLLPYRSPYDWPAMLAFLKARAVAGLEIVTDEAYSRVIELGGVSGSINLTHVPRKAALRAIVRFPNLSDLSAIITRIRRMFDLSADPSAIASALSSDPTLAPLVSARPGLRLPGGWNGFEIAVRAILGQQITVKAATHLVARVVTTLGEPIAPASDLPGLTHIFPRPEKFDARTLARLGIPRARSAALAGIAKAAAKDPQLFEPRRDLDEAVAQLRQLRGIGEWTAQYIAMRALGETDAFPAGDVAMQRQLATAGRRPAETELIQRAERWRPWRAYATLHLWTAGANARQLSKIRSTEKHHAAQT